MVMLDGIHFEMWIEQQYCNVKSNSQGCILELANTGVCLNCSGVVPVQLRNARKNELGSSKPKRNAISAVGRVVFCK
jgi:hypothetical protein